MKERFFCAVTAFLLACVFLTSCLTIDYINDDAQVKKPYVPVHSAVYIEYALYAETCNEDGLCAHEFISGINGSGIIFKNEYSNKSSILTAAHVCHDVNKTTILKSLDLTPRDSYLIFDNYGIQYSDFKIAKIDVDHDLCLLESDESFHDGVIEVDLALSTEGMVYGERVYNISYPRGYYVAGAPYIGEGNFSGMANKEKYVAQIFNFPIAPGSSGSGVFNEKGELIGMVSAYVPTFQYIAISININDINEFISK